MLKVMSFIFLLQMWIWRQSRSQIDQAEKDHREQALSGKGFTFILFPSRISFTFLQ